MEDELYKEHILNHYRNPRNKRILIDADAACAEVNSLCGDDVTMYYKCDTDGIITDMTFMGDGCAISQAAASLVTEYAVGKQLRDIVAYTPKHMEELLRIPVSVARSRCAMLPVRALQNAFCHPREGGDPFLNKSGFPFARE